MNNPFSLSSVIGAWSLARHISDDSRLNGRATFVDGMTGSVDYHEQGALTLPSGETFEAYRRYVFRPTALGFSVWFVETPLRLFHEITLTPEAGGWVGQAVHHCGDDEYRSRYDFRTPNHFTINHHVDGPRKAYTMVTHYHRESLV